MYEGDEALVGRLTLATIVLLQHVTVEGEGHQGEHEGDGQP